MITKVMQKDIQFLALDIPLFIDWAMSSSWTPSVVHILPQ